MLPQLRDKKTAVAIAGRRGVDLDVPLTVALIDVALGLAVTVVMLMIGMPNALLWGALAGLGGVRPYIGADGLLFTLAMAGLVTFPTLGHALHRAGGLSRHQSRPGPVVTPMVMGRRLTLNPVAI